MWEDNTVNESVGMGTQLAFTCSKLTIATPEQGLKYAQS